MIKHVSKNQLLCIICMLIVSLDSSAQQSEGFWSIQLENDLWGSNDDRFYTHGAKLSFASGAEPPQLLQRLPALFPFYRQGETQLYGYEIAQTIFTPEDITQTGLIEDDRPYAGWLYFNTGMGHIFEDRGDREWMNFLGITIGMVGPSSQSDEIQTLVHKLVDGTDPEGWSNQLHDEIGVNVAYLNKYRQIYDFDERLQYEMGPHYGFMLGNVYTFGTAGFLLRYGTNLKADIGPPSIGPGFSGVPAFNPNTKTHWYLFAGLELRLMLRNIFLDGNTFRDSHSVEKEELVGDLQLGFAYHFDDMRLSFVQMFRTREFEGQPESVQYGAINLTVYYE